MSYQLPIVLPHQCFFFFFFKSKLKLRHVKSHHQLNSSPSPLPHPQDLFSSSTNSLSPILTNFIFGSLEIQWNYCDLFLFFLKNDLAMEVEIGGTKSLSPILTNFIFGSLEIQWNYCDLFLFFLKNDLAMEVEIAFSLKLLQVGLYKHISKSLLFLFVKFVMYFYSFPQAL